MRERPTALEPAERVKALRRQHGVSVVEIMVAMVASLILIGGVLEIYSMSRRNYVQTDQGGRIQENGRLALLQLTQDVRQAGYLGCKTRSTLGKIKSVAKKVFVPGAGRPLFSGIDNIRTRTPQLFPGIGPIPEIKLNDAVRGTDALTVVYAVPCGGRVATSISGTSVGSAQLSAGANCSLDVGKPMLVADCATQHIFRIPDPGAAQNDSDTFGKSYLADNYAELFEYQVVTYYIKISESRRQPVLFRKEWNTSKAESLFARGDEIVPDIEDMQVEYALDTDAPGDGSANRWLTATQVGDVFSPTWGQVVAVRITLTARSADETAGNQTATATYDGSTITDRRLRKTFSTVLTLRNRSG